MQKAKRKLRFFGIGIIFFLLIYIIVIFFSKNTEGSENKRLVNVYFLNPTTNKFEPELHYIEQGENKEVATNVLKLLFDGPSSSKLNNTVSDKIEFIDGRIVNDSVLEIEFSSGYNKMTPLEEMFFRGSLVWTMTDLDFIQDVHIYVDGKELTSQAGTPIGLLNRKNVIIQTNIPPEPLNHKTVKLYFIKAGNQQLAPETLTIRVKDLPIEFYIVEELIDGPTAKDLLPTIPQGTKLREVKTDEGVCYLNLSMEFITKHAGTEIEQQLTVYSIVNSLTELNTVNKVQFLIEPEKQQEIKGLFDLSKPIESNDELVEK